MRLGKLLVVGTFLGGMLFSGCGPGKGPSGEEDPNIETPVDTGNQNPSNNNNNPVPTTPSFIDTDVSVSRLNADGTLDTTFGANGTAVINFSDGANSAKDALWGATLDASGRVLLFGSRKATEANRYDADRVVARLTADGKLDETFATKGLHVLNVANLNDGARHGMVQPDGKILSAGYTSQPTGVGTQSANRVVLLRLNADGTPDNTFGVGGVVNSNPFRPANPDRDLWGMAEAYAVGYQNGKYVTTGYGRSAATGTVDMVSFRYTETGELDTTWGEQGIAKIDLIGENDRGRNLVVLPDGRVVFCGSATPVPGNIDAMLAVMTPNGTLDTTVGGDGVLTFDLGRPDESLFGIAVDVAHGRLAAVGYQTGAVNGVTEDDDAILVVMGLTGEPVARTVALSPTANDRLHTVVFDASGKIYATGYISDGTESQTVVARFNADGTPDNSFGVEGVVKLDLTQGGTDEAGRGVAVLPDGKLLVTGVVEHK